MNTTCKLLAAAWMACCTTVRADTITWDQISHFFNFETVEAEKMTNDTFIAKAYRRTNLATNIRLLVEEQLKLPSGQNLWKAFRFWEEQHPELSFQFEFVPIDSLGAHIELKRYDDASQAFVFEILCNKVFADKCYTYLLSGFSTDLGSEEDGLQKFLNENMLYRPCLIKLVDPDDPNKWEYHLREQELPFFITLAHEFLHALNQLECIDWLIEKNEDFSNPKRRIQEFLIKKLNKPPAKV